MKKIFILSMLVLLSSCATTAKYEAKLNTWLGSTEPELLKSWGPPDSVYEISESEKMLTYISNRSMYIPGSAPTYRTSFVGSTAYTSSYGGYSSRNIQMSCKTIFTLKDRVITNWNWKGNDCKSMD